ncbi:MAG: T9SS type A sorting domain-containing protein [Bacteroidia bacterium]|nr:T9SS type A sorting domain-containing protein [Bacteroidia bacterium]
MKTTISFFVTILICTLGFMGMTPVQAQVRTTVLSEDQKIEDFIPFYTEDRPESHLLPVVDVAAAIAEDRRTGNPYARFGIKSSVSFRETDGAFYESNQQTTVWKLVLNSPGATSLNFVMENLNLPPGSEMYLSAPAGFMVMGPIQAEFVFEGIFASDLIWGESVEFTVILPSALKKEFSIHLTEAVHGYSDRASRVFGESGWCTVDVNCPQGVGWERERDAVAMVISGNLRLCSGALVNNACQDLRPFYLTAFHCIDSNEDSVLSGKELGKLNSWVFRFNYDSPNPTPPTCRGSEPATWLSYSGAQFRAGWANSDFALVELNGSILNQTTSLALAGWDRNDFAPIGGTGIHHPKGDVKKISVDNDTLTIQGWGSNTSAGTTHLRAIWEDGDVEGGSSGSPIFDPNHRLMGQLHGGPPECQERRGIYGRFFSSWTGGGTNNSRLSNWLGGGNNPNIINTIRIPRLLPTNAGTLCYGSSQSFTMQDPLPGAVISWQATPANLFATASGNSATAILSPANSLVSGQGTLTFRMGMGNGCNDVVFTRTLWVGKPGMPGTSPTGNPPISIGLGALQTVTITGAPGAFYTSGTWWANGSITANPPAAGQAGVFEATSLGTGNFYVQTSNSCGVSPAGGGAMNVTSGGGGMYRIAPNPAREEITVEISDSAPEANRKILVSDLNGKVLLQIRSEERRITIPLQTLQPGIYLLQIRNTEATFTSKIAINR